ncbi:MAG: ATP-binding cassette domain-containing protein [Clostridia bacterium]|jgi:ABC-2 type transport system ATP-binding protein|nr:ATP-binding cassette domain-containing protein [Clostridia bacterium]
MSDNVITVKNLTKDYGKGRGIFDISFELRRGETLGFIGANGAGKTTTLRNIMGFLKCDSGEIEVEGLHAWQDAEKIKKFIGYVPGEIAFPDLKTGTAFIKSQAELLALKDMTYANQLASKLQLDLSAGLKRMSKGMKQKTALVAALMNDPEILILDEATTGLDPLMRLAFLEIMECEKRKGKSIIITSHLYEELEKICDRVALIDKGHIINIIDMKEFRSRTLREYKIEFKNKNDYKDFCKLDYQIIRKQPNYNQVTISIEKNALSQLFKELAMFDVKFISEVKYTLENALLANFKDAKANEK